MEVKFTVTKEERKALVKAIGEFVGLAPVYLGAPSFKFAVGDCIVDKDGVVVFAEGTSTEDIRSLIAEMAERGFVFEGNLDEIAPAVAEQTEAAPDGCAFHAPISDGADKLSINMPLSGFTVSAIDNLGKLVTAKAWVIKKMVSADDLPIDRDEEQLHFPWFSRESSPDEVDAYSHLVARLCATAKEKQRITATERQLEDGDNEKFKARCFLLSLGFIGKEYAQARKILLAPMSGSGSFKSGVQKKPDAQDGANTAASGDGNGEAIHACEVAEPPAYADNAPVLPKCGDCEYHCYYTEGLMHTSAGDVVDTSKREPGSYTHYCLKVPSGYRKIKHAVDWNGSETAPKWCPLYTGNENITVSDGAEADGSDEEGACHDCLACANSLSEPPVDGEDIDKLFCVVKQTYVGDDESCGEFNS